MASLYPQRRPAALAKVAGLVAHGLPATAITSTTRRQQRRRRKQSIVWYSHPRPVEICVRHHVDILADLYAAAPVEYRLGAADADAPVRAHLPRDKRVVCISGDGAGCGVGLDEGDVGWEGSAEHA